MEGTDIEEVLEYMCTQLLQKYEGLLETMEGSDIVFVCVVEMAHNFHRVEMNRGSSNIDLPTWITNKKCCINPKNKDDDECFK